MLCCVVLSRAMLRRAVVQVAYADGFSVLSDVLVEMRTIIGMGLHWDNQVRLVLLSPSQPLQHFHKASASMGMLQALCAACVAQRRCYCQGSSSAVTVLMMHMMRPPTKGCT